MGYSLGWGHKWGMLHISRHETKGMSAPMFQHNKKGNYLFTRTELKFDWRLDEWKQLDGCLRIAKIDPEFSLTEYPIDELSSMVQ